MQLLVSALKDYFKLANNNLPIVATASLLAQPKGPCSRATEPRDDGTALWRQHDRRLAGCG